ncbi:MAG: glycosyltransferase [Pseudomonadota bacterium]
MRKLTVDIIVPVYSSPHHARHCIESVLAHASPPYHLYVVDDASDANTASILSELIAGAGDKATLITNEQNRGYLQSVNRGIESGSGELVVLLNSDAMILPGTLERLEQAFAAHPDVGVVNPVSTWANWTRIPFPPGTNITSLGKHVERLGEDELADIWNASGFFFVVRRSLYEELGMFDKVYDPGYWEEADFCMRALEAGHRVVVDRKLYVFHFGWGSFQKGGRDDHMSRNKGVFMKRWEAQFAEYDRKWRANNPVRKLTEDLELLELPDPETDPRICFLVPSGEPCSSYLGIIHLVNRLCVLGMNANMAIVGEDDEDVYKQVPMYFRPYTMNGDGADRRFPFCEHVVATHSSTIPIALKISSVRPDVSLSQLLVKDELGEVDEDSMEFSGIKRALGMIGTRVILRQRIADRLSVHDVRGPGHMLRTAVNRDIYYPKSHYRSRDVLVHVPDDASREDRKLALSVCAELARSRPNLKLAVIGAELQVDVEEEGIMIDNLSEVLNQTEVATHLSSSTIVLDCGGSTRGHRLVLEAMACGAAVVCTPHGGVTDYAKHRHNCLMFEPGTSSSAVTAITDLLDGRRLLDELRACAQETVAAHCHRAQAEQFSALLPQFSVGNEGAIHGV